MDIKKMRELCEDIKQAIMEANNRGELPRVQVLKFKRKQIKQKILQCKSGSRPTPTSAIQN